MSSPALVLQASALEQKLEFIRFPFGEIPRGAWTEIVGPASSGRTAFLCSLLAAASAEHDYCAVVDAQNTFNPEDAAQAGVQLSQLLWVRCSGNVEHALKATDWLARAGGFGLVALDLGDTPVTVSHRIQLAAWFRLRHAVENTRTALVSLSQRVHAPSCSALKIELCRERVLWRGMGPGRMLAGLTVAAGNIKNHRKRESIVTIPC